MTNWLTQLTHVSAAWSHRRIVATSYADVIAHNAEGLDKLLENKRHVLKHDRTTTVAKCEFIDQAVIVKRYNPRNKWHTIKRALRQSRAKRCWQMSYVFSDAGLNVAQPILMYEKRVGPIRFDAYFVSQFLDGEELLNALPSMAVSEQLMVKHAMQDAFSKMEKAKLSHGDLKASNLIWKDHSLYFIDLDAAQKHISKITWSKAHKKDRKRFMKNWRGQAELLDMFQDLS